MRSREELQNKFKKYISRPRSKTELQTKLRHYMSKPVRALHKARDFYVKSLEDCATKASSHGSLFVYSTATSGVSRLPKSFNVNYSKSNDDDKFMNFLETMSKKRSMESNLREQEETRQRKDQYGGFNRSFSINIGLSRIDEDKPCYFEEEDAVYGRSRSCAYKRSFHY